MNRAKVGSVLFVGAALFFLASPSESDALAGPALRGDEGPSHVQLDKAGDLGAKTIAANAGPKPAGAPAVGTTGNCAEGQVEVGRASCRERVLCVV